MNELFNKTKGEPYSINTVDNILDEIDNITINEEFKSVSALVEENIVDNQINLNFRINETEKFFVDRINIDNLPDVILDYISENYPNAEVKIAWRVRGKIVVGIITPDGRKIVVFDLDGNFLFDRG